MAQDDVQPVTRKDFLVMVRDICRDHFSFDGGKKIENRKLQEIADLCSIGIQGGTDDPDDLLNSDELKALEMSGELANLLRKICCQETRTWRERHLDASQVPESQQDHDWAELAQYIHMIQTKVMSQAAARAYPDKFRLIGQVRK